MKKLSLCVAVALGIGSAGASFATTLDFDTIPSCLSATSAPTPYHEEGGYGVSGLNGFCYGGFDNIYMSLASDSGHHDAVEIARIDGGLFTLTQFDVDPPFDYFTDPDFVLTGGDDMIVEGFIGGMLVSSVTYSSLFGDTLVATPGFGDVERIVFRENPGFGGALDFSRLGIGGGAGFDHYTHGLDNIVLRAAVAPVPLPLRLQGFALGCFCSAVRFAEKARVLTLATRAP